MTMINKSDELWSGNYGDNYNIRNDKSENIANNKAMFAKMGLPAIQSVMEYGCGYGFCLLALKELFPCTEMHGLEINQMACSKAASYGINIANGSLNSFQPQRTYDLVLTKGMLMYISDEDINNAYRVLYESTNKYIAICEYYNPSTVIINHHQNVLHKRDYGKIMDLYPDLKLKNYGFVYKRDKNPQDDITWFLFEKP